MTSFREQLLAACKAKASPLGRKLTAAEVFEVAVGVGEAIPVAKPPRKKAPVSSEAEQVYELYPKKVGREDALRAITKALKKNTVEYLMDKTNQFKECVASWPSSYRYFQDGGDRCPHPASWYNAGRYADDPREWKRHGARTAAPHHVIPKEPEGWREHFPDFLHADKPWAHLDDASRQHIIVSMAAKNMTAPVEQDAFETRLRHA